MIDFIFILKNVFKFLNFIFALFLLLKFVDLLILYICIYFVFNFNFTKSLPILLLFWNAKKIYKYFGHQAI